MCFLEFPQSCHIYPEIKAITEVCKYFSYQTSEAFIIFQDNETKLGESKETHSTIRVLLAEYS